MAASEDEENRVLSDIHVHARRQEIPKSELDLDLNYTHYVEKGKEIEVILQKCGPHELFTRFYFVIPTELEDPQPCKANERHIYDGSSSWNESTRQAVSDLKSNECYKQKKCVKKQELDTINSCDKYMLDSDGDLNVSRRNTGTSSDVWCQKRTTNLETSPSSHGRNKKLGTSISIDERNLGVITIEHKMETPLKDVGYQLWTGALLLCDYLLDQGSSFKLKHSGVLDLGAGLGITSIVAAMFAPLVICTDYRADILVQAEQNWERNKWLLPQVQCADILFRILDWTIEPDFHAEADKNKYVFDQKEEPILHSTNTILAAEVIYDEDLTDAFFKTIYHLLLYPPSKEILVTLEKRIVFQTENRQVCSPAYEHFHENLKDLVSVDEGPVRFCAEQISTDFPQYFQYTRNKEMELWRISSRFIDTDLVKDS